MIRWVSHRENIEQNLESPTVWKMYQLLSVHYLKAQTCCRLKHLIMTVFFLAIGLSVPFLHLTCTVEWLAALQRDVSLPRFTFVTRWYRQRSIWRIHRRVSGFVSIPGGKHSQFSRESRCQHGHKRQWSCCGFVCRANPPSSVLQSLSWFT